MALVIIQSDEGEELHRSRVTGVEPKLLAATMMMAIAKMPAPRKERSDKGKPRISVLPDAANGERSQVIP